MARVVLKSQKQIVGILKSEAGVKAAVREKADEIAVVAESRLAPHRQTGAAHIEVTQGRVDAYVGLVDEAAMSIEFGHEQYVAGHPTGRFTPGLYIITGAAGLLN